MRCKIAVEAALQASGVAYHTVKLGGVLLSALLKEAQKKSVLADWLITDWRFWKTTARF